MRIYQDLNEEILSCSKCDLGNSIDDNTDYRIIGQGNKHSDIMFISESPGKLKNVYNNMLKFLELSKDDVYTTSIVLCSPPKYNDPEFYNIIKCSDYLQRQIQVVNPKLIVTFGRLAAQSFISNFKINKDHGKIAKSEIHNVDIFPMYHTAYYGAYVSNKKRQEFKKDVNRLKYIIQKGFINVRSA